MIDSKDSINTGKKERSKPKVEIHWENISRCEDCGVYHGRNGWRHPCEECGGKVSASKISEWYRGAEPYICAYVYLKYTRVNLWKGLQNERPSNDEVLGMYHDFIAKEKREKKPFYHRDINPAAIVGILIVVGLILIMAL